VAIDIKIDGAYRFSRLRVGSEIMPFCMPWRMYSPLHTDTAA